MSTLRSCLGCGHAVWRRTTAGSLHPDKTGKCGYLPHIPALPNAYYYLNSPAPIGGYIDRAYVYKSPCPHHTEAAVLGPLS